MVIAVWAGVYTSAVLRRDYPQGGDVSWIYEAPANSHDVICCGSSHAYCSFNPLELYEECGLRSFVLGTRRQPLPATYYYLAEALKRQHPRVVLLESYMAIGEESISDREELSALLHDTVVRFPWCENRVKMTESFCISGGREDLYLDIMMYHGRWKEIGRSDFIPDVCQRPYLRGYKPNRGNDIGELPRKDSSAKMEPIPADKLMWIEAINDLVRMHGAQLLVFTAPFNVRTMPLVWGRYVSLKDFLAQKRITYIDFFDLYDEVHFSEETDFVDPFHLSALGARKLTRYMGRYLRSRCEFELTHPETISTWDADLAQYRRVRCGFGIVDSTSTNAQWTVIKRFEAVSIGPKSRWSKYIKLSFDPRPGKVYRITFKEVSLDAGMSSIVRVKLYDVRTSADVVAMNVDVNKKREIILEVPKQMSQYGIYLGTGITKEEDRRKGATYRDVVIEEMQ